MRALLTIVLSTFVVASTALAAERNGGQRIRPLDDRIIAMIAAGVARSASFRALVERVEASGVFVHIGMSPLLKSTVAGAGRGYARTPRAERSTGNRGRAYDI